MKKIHLHIIASLLILAGSSLNAEADQLAVDCKDCSEADRKMNQRSELSVVDASQVPTTPDGVLYYDFNKWLLPEGAGCIVFGTIKELKANPTYRVEIAGFTDEVGSFTSNKRISQLRSTNIRNIFTANGVDDSRIDLEWYGESVPHGGCLVEYPCPSESHSKNRIVEIRVQK